MKCKGCENQRLWPTLHCYSGCILEELRNTTETLVKDIQCSCRASPKHSRFIQHARYQLGVQNKSIISTLYL
jgi:hypothetical protein